MEDQELNRKRNMMATSIASPFAGMIAKFVMHPIDTIKSKVQVNRMELKSVSDYKFGMVSKLSKFLIKFSQTNIQERRCTRIFQRSHNFSLWFSICFCLLHVCIWAYKTLFSESWRKSILI